MQYLDNRLLLESPFLRNPLEVSNPFAKGLGAVSYLLGRQLIRTAIVLFPPERFIRNIVNCTVPPQKVAGTFGKRNCKLRRTVNPWDLHEMSGTGDHFVQIHVDTADVLVVVIDRPFLALANSI